MDFEELFKPYTEDGYTLENTTKYLKKTSAAKGLSPEALPLMIQRVFTELWQGKKFSKIKCRCGCGIDKSGTDLEHYMVLTMLEINGRINMAQIKEISNIFNKAVKEAKKGRWTNWNKSPVLRMLGYNKVR